MAVQGLCCSAGFSLVAASGDYPLVGVLGLPIVLASLFFFFDTGSMHLFFF